MASLPVLFAIAVTPRTWRIGIDLEKAKLVENAREMWAFLQRMLAPVPGGNSDKQIHHSDYLLNISGTEYINSPWGVN